MLFVASTSVPENVREAITRAGTRKNAEAHFEEMMRHVRPEDRGRIMSKKLAEGDWASDFLVIRLGVLELIDELYPAP